MSKITTILFDNDGVLVHTERFVFELNREILQSLGVEYSRDDFIQHTFLTGTGSSGWLRMKGYDEDFIHKFGEERNRRWEMEISLDEICEPSAPSVLSKLVETYDLCVVTNTREEIFELYYQNNPIRALLKGTVFREDYTRSKPSPDAYRVAMTKMNVSAEQAIVIEDSPRGIEAAQKAGLRVIATVNPQFAHLDTSQAEFHIQNLNELPELLESL